MILYARATQPNARARCAAREPRPGRNWSQETGGQRSSFYLKPVVLDDWVAEDLVAGIVDLLAGGFLVRASQFDLHVFADVHSADPGVAHLARAFCTVLPCGSSTAFFGVITILAFIRERDSQAAGPNECWRSRQPKARSFLVLRVLASLTPIAFWRQVVFRVKHIPRV